jgi:exosome complex RNA-binding protein Rrp4
MNGYVYIVGKNIPMAIKLIKIIEKKAHTRGLTHYIEELIKKEGGNDE